MENNTNAATDGKDPSTFLSEITGAPVTVKLNSGVFYKGELQSVDGYMNIALEKAEEYVNGNLRRSYGDAFVRGNNVKAMSLQSIRYKRGMLRVLDQLQVPHVESYIPVTSASEGWHVIKEMHVRGAPAIAIVAVLSLSVELDDLIRADKLSPYADDVEAFILEKLDYLVTSRPTAVNLGDAAKKLKALVQTRKQIGDPCGNDLAEAYIEAAERMLVDDALDNHRLGDYGAAWVVKNSLAGQEGKKVGVLTHCNTGSLATAGYGTALGIIRSLHASEELDHAYCTETRPYNQGARLTAFELVHDKIPATLITDSMAAALLAEKGNDIAAIVVGADRVVANGDTANKIGTYSLAVLARHHGVKFVVAAPRTTIDLLTKEGSDIVIEQRSKSEVTKITGPRHGGARTTENDKVVLETIDIAAPGVDVWNPSFDVTPYDLIDAIVTEVGVAEKDANGLFHLQRLFGY
ncbi:S-methyl-5-thioribose-1-phosphate isomerase [Myotisia sp. PD_48]|nr:S-methyl-5-thioribose-1-phosphate isomerase [Myotisia sp. PD_48]